MVSRREIIGGAGAILLGALGYRAWDRGAFQSGSGEAYAPWDDWLQGEGIVRPIHSAVLAASPHDTQPWKFIAAGNTIEVMADRARNLGSFDPFRREMHLGIGCAVENLNIAGQAFGYTCNVFPVNGKLALSPSEQTVPAVQFGIDIGTAVHDRLFDMIPKRHTNRGPYYGDRTLTPQLLDEFHRTVDSPDVRLVLINDPIARGEFASLEVAATQAIIADKQMSTDSSQWFRTSKDEIRIHRDGVTMDTAGLPPLMVIGAKMLPDQGGPTADKYWLDMTRDTHAGTAALFGMIMVRDRLDMASAIAAGRAWQRLHLTATYYGVGAQPMNQPVEMVDRNAMLGRADSFAHALQHFAHMPGWEPTFTFRMGYAVRDALPSPRRALRDVLMSA
jgi:hypothetical protein